MTSDPEYRDVQYSRMLAVLGGFIVFGVGVAVGAVFGATVRLVVWVILLLVLAALLVVTRVEFRVDARGVTAGRAFVEWAYVDRVEVLTGAAMRAAITTDAHPRDYLRLRSTASGARVWLDDPTDPHRSWVVSVRRPDALEAALLRLGVAHAR